MAPVNARGDFIAAGEDPTTWTGSPPHAAAGLDSGRRRWTAWVVRARRPWSRRGGIAALRGLDSTPAPLRPQRLPDL